VRPDLSASRLARVGAVIVAVGLVIFVIGLDPGVIGLDLTPGIGLIQIGVFLFGLALMTLGAYIYLYATRHRGQPPRLRHDIGVRLMATGLVAAFATGFADVLGIGSQFGAERPELGWLQATGVGLSILIILVGIFLYSFN